MRQTWLIPKVAAPAVESPLGDKIRPTRRARATKVTVVNCTSIPRGNRAAEPVVISGLESLEYRGYDSAGIAVIDKNVGEITKRVGRVQALKDAIPEHKIPTHLAIGHTRWATHGAPTMLNAHPHTNTDGTIFVVHNGIIENYQEIKAKLQSEGYVFVSQTDTEVIPHLIDYYLRELKSFEPAFISRV